MISTLTSNQGFVFSCQGFVFSCCFCLVLNTASGQPQSGDIVETIPCRSCYIHPDSKDENLAYCDEDTVECPAHEGCWELKKEDYTLSGCMKEVTSQHSGAHPVYSEKDMSYCTKLWKNGGGACTRGEMCLSCSTAVRNHTSAVEMVILLSIICLQTVQLFRLI